MIVATITSWTIVLDLGIWLFRLFIKFAKEFVTSKPHSKPESLGWKIAKRLESKMWGEKNLTLQKIGRLSCCTIMYIALPFLVFLCFRFYYVTLFVGIVIAGLFAARYVYNKKQNKETACKTLL